MFISGYARSLLPCGFSVVATSGGSSVLSVLSTFCSPLVSLLSLAAERPTAHGINRCEPLALEPRVSSCGPRALWLQPSGESPCRDGAWESCVGRWLPHHCTARQVPPAVSNLGVCPDVCASSRIVDSVLTPPRGSTPWLSFPRASVPSLSTRNHHSTGNWLYFSTK